MEHIVTQKTGETRRRWDTAVKDKNLDCIRTLAANKTICYTRRKLKSRTGAKIKPPLIRFGNEVAAILARRQEKGALFLYLRTVRPSDRATEFKQRCEGLKIEGVTLHSYRYAWAECALKCGYPERFAQQALGHNSKAVHHAYSKHAEVTVPSLDDWENAFKKNPEKIRKPAIVRWNFGRQAERASSSRYRKPPRVGDEPILTQP